MSKWLLILSLCFTLSACRFAQITGGKIKEVTLEEIEQQLLQTQLQYNTFSAKTKVEVQTDAEVRTVNASIDMQKDTYIGISLRMMGIEGARVLITPDSVKIIDRLNQKYYPYTFSYIEEIVGMSLDFATLQDLIAGNLVLYNGTIYPGTPDDEKYVLWSNNGIIKNTIWLYPSFHVMRMQIDDLLHPRSMILENSGYRKVAGQAFAYLRQLQVSTVDNMEIDLEFTSLTLNEPIDFPFTVNPKYEVVH